jgi:hypothetical protein
VSEEKVAAGSIVDGLGVTLDPLTEGELVESCVVLLKVVDAEGRVALEIGASDRLDWITQLGIVEAARGLLSPENLEDG